MDKTKGKTIGLLAMVVVVTIYGVSYISRAVISEYLPTVVILVIQMAIMTILFTGYNLITRKNMKVKKKDWGIIILSGLFGTTFFHGFTILGVNAVGATVSSLLFGFAAVFALIMEFVLFHRKKTRMGIL
ncbi:MAG: EamA family transporter [Blautia coccoides]